jgi:glycine betaine catabolism A
VGEPAAAYTSAELLASELRRLWRRSWVCAGHAGSWPHPGHQGAVSVAGVGVLLVRDQDGTLRGFFNVCRHRGHELLECGTAVVGRTVRCPYHAWVYRLDGRLRTAPRFGRLDPDDPVWEGLVPTRVAEWHGWVFVDVSGQARDLADQVGGVEALLGPYRPEALVPAARRRHLVRANWKVLVEDHHGRHPPPPQAARRRVLYLFPNLLVSTHPDHLLTHRLEPVAPDQTQVECEWLAAPAAAGRLAAGWRSPYPRGS